MYTSTYIHYHLRECQWRLVEGSALVRGADDEHAHVLLLRRFQGQQVAALGARARGRVRPDKLVTHTPVSMYAGKKVCINVCASVCTCVCVCVCVCVCLCVGVYVGVCV